MWHSPEGAFTVLFTRARTTGALDDFDAGVGAAQGAGRSPPTSIRPCSYALWDIDLTTIPLIPRAGPPVHRAAFWSFRLTWYSQPAGTPSPRQDC